MLERSETVRVRRIIQLLIFACVAALCAAGAGAAPGGAATDQQAKKFLFIAPMFNIQGAGISIDAISRSVKTS